MYKIVIFLNIFLFAIFSGNLLAGDCPFKFEKAKSNPDIYIARTRDFPEGVVPKKGEMLFVTKDGFGHLRVYLKKGAEFYVIKHNDVLTCKVPE